MCYDGSDYFVVGTSASSAYVSGIAAGYMEANQGNVAQMQSYLQSNYGVQMDPGQ